MWTPPRRLVGDLTILGGVLAIVATVPPRWYGPIPTDSYVFEPPLFSPLWIERVVLPPLSVLAALLVVVGLLSLFRRDRPWMGRWHRWSASAAILGGAVGTLATTLFAATGGGSDDLTAAATALLGALLALVALVFALPGLIGWGIGYLRAERDRQTLGLALVGAPVLAALFVAVGAVVGSVAELAGGLPTVLPFAALAVVVGVDLRQRRS
ncbi:hypothetical protein [Haloplanus halobius]|uniref:hypothetical protein n=1 Tax=Haloplanus halobius TaxID=2934938 RepID=UPI003CE55CFF